MPKYGYNEDGIAQWAKNFNKPEKIKLQSLQNFPWLSLKAGDRINLFLNEDSFYEYQGRTWSYQRIQEEIKAGLWKEIN